MSMCYAGCMLPTSVACPATLLHDPPVVTTVLNITNPAGCCSCACSATVVVNVQTNVSWDVGFIIPAGAFVFAIAVFLIGAPLYRWPAARLGPGVYEWLYGLQSHAWPSLVQL